MLRGPKLLWHDTLVAHPETHAWVLSLYRAGEFHPQTVDDYFPSWAAPTDELRVAMERHAADEGRHVRIYDRAIARLGVPRVEFAGRDVFNVVIRHETAAGFAVTQGDAPDVRVTKVAHFLAHAHHLEKRIARSLEFHLDACHRIGASAVAAAVQAVHGDEERHARYTREAVFDLLPRPRALATLAMHRAAERRAHLAFSSRQVRSFLSTFKRRGTLRDRTLFRAAAAMMESAHDLLD